VDNATLQSTLRQLDALRGLDPRPPVRTALAAWRQAWSPLDSMLWLLAAAAALVRDAVPPRLRGGWRSLQSCRRAGGALFDLLSRWAGRGLPRALLLRLPSAWAARPWQFLPVGVGVAALIVLGDMVHCPGGGWLDFSDVELFLATSLIGFAGAGHWIVVARRHAMPLGRGRAWRAYALTVALAMAVVFLVPMLHLLRELGGPQGTPKCGSLTVNGASGFALATGLVVTAALLAQVAPGLTSWWAAGLTFAVIVWQPERPALALQLGWVVVAASTAGVQWRDGWLVHRAWRAAAIGTVAFPPWVAYKSAAALLGALESQPLATVLTVHVLAQALAIGVVVGPAVQGLHAARDHPPG
jgi:hypothetical protein